MGEQIPFNELPRIEKIKRIAQDVIVQLRARKFSAGKGKYLCMDGTPNVWEINSDNCFCCAIGASYLALKRLQESQELLVSSVPLFEMGNILGCGLFASVEGAFEGWTDKDSSQFHFFANYDNPAERMQAIFQNILDNDGEFRP